MPRRRRSLVAQYHALRSTLPTVRTEDAIKANPYDLALCGDTDCPSAARCYRSSTVHGFYMDFSIPRRGCYSCPYALFLRAKE